MHARPDSVLENCTRPLLTGYRRVIAITMVFGISLSFQAQVFCINNLIPECTGAMVSFLAGNHRYSA